MQPFGGPGRPGRVDDRVEVVFGHGRRRLVERRRVRGREVGAVRREPVEVVIREDVPERREVVGDGLDLRELLGVLADDGDRLGVREQVADVLGRARRIDRDPDRSDSGEREVDERPLEAVPREQRHVVALAHAAAEQAVGIRPNALVRLRPRDVAPAVVSLGQVRRRRAARRDGVVPELRDRAPGCAGNRGFRGRLRPSPSHSELSPEGVRRFQVESGKSAQA